MATRIGCETACAAFFLVSRQPRRSARPAAARRPAAPSAASDALVIPACARGPGAKLANCATASRTHAADRPPAAPQELSSRGFSSGHAPAPPPAPFQRADSAAAHAALARLEAAPCEQHAAAEPRCAACGSLAGVTRHRGRRVAAPPSCSALRRSAASCRLALLLRRQTAGRCCRRSSCPPSSATAHAAAAGSKRLLSSLPGAGAPRASSVLFSRALLMPCALLSAPYALRLRGAAAGGAGRADRGGRRGAASARDPGCRTRRTSYGKAHGQSFERQRPEAPALRRAFGSAGGDHAAALAAV